MAEPVGVALVGVVVGPGKRRLLVRGGHGRKILEGWNPSAHRAGRRKLQRIALPGQHPRRIIATRFDSSMPGVRHRPRHGPRQIRRVREHRGQGPRQRLAQGRAGAVRDLAELAGNLGHNARICWHVDQGTRSAADDRPKLATDDDGGTGAGVTLELSLSLARKSTEILCRPRAATGTGSDLLASLS